MVVLFNNIYFRKLNLGTWVASFIAYLEGLFLGLSLIIAIGAQNLFVFHQGLIGKYVFLVCIFCSVSDALLIYIGYSGMFFILNKSDNLQTFMLILNFGFMWFISFGFLKCWDYRWELLCLVYFNFCSFGLFYVIV